MGLHTRALILLVAAAAAGCGKPAPRVADVPNPGPVPIFAAATPARVVSAPQLAKPGPTPVAVLSHTPIVPKISDAVRTPQVSPSIEGFSPTKPPETPINPTGAASPPLFALPEAPELSPAGESLILEYETGGQRDYSRNPHPEAPDARYSGITVGIGYDCSTNSPSVVLGDWRDALGARNAQRLAATHPWRGAVAQANLARVRDILVGWEPALGVFDRVDVTRTFSQCQHAFPGFDDLRPNAQAALVSLAFNRGTSMIGDGRREMRAIRDDGVPHRDYDLMAAQERAMVRVWRGTEIYNGMKRRRYAEADLILTP